MSSIIPKKEQKQFNLRYHGSKVDFFVRLLEELKIPKRHFEINWPLVRPLRVIVMRLKTIPLVNSDQKKRKHSYFGQTF